MFQRSLPRRCLLENFVDMMNNYQEEKKKLKEIALKMCAEEFCYQKGAVFGFGLSSNLNIEIATKISNADVVT